MQSTRDRGWYGAFEEMAASTTCQRFRQGKQQQQERRQHLHHDGSGRVLPSAYVGSGSALRPDSSVPAPSMLGMPSSSSPARSLTGAQALKIHSEAERRRRERINAHLATLRRMISDGRQMDKATLLDRVVRQLKDLKTKAAETTQQRLPPIPAEANCVTVDCYNGVTGSGRPAAYIRASVSCDDRPGLLAGLAGAVGAMRLRPLRADMASLGGRAQCDLLLCREEEGDEVVSAGGRVTALEEGVRQALAKAAFPETAYGCSARSRRQRLLGLLGHELGVGDHRW